MRHARLSASSAHRWMNCAGAPRMEAGMPEVETEYSVEGTAAHTLAANALTLAGIEGVDVARRAVWALSEIAVESKEGGIIKVVVTDEMRNAVMEYVVTVIEAYDALPDPKRLYIEQQLSLARLDPPEAMFGTSDAVILAPQLLHIFDFKYGTGVVVEVLRNPQLMEYALGAMYTLPRVEGAGAYSPWMSVEFRTTIVQPRAAHPDGVVRTASYDYPALRDFGHTLIEAARKAHTPDAPLTPGSWCRWCKAAGSCPALYKYSQEAAQNAFAVAPYVEETTAPAATLPDPEHLPMEQALLVLDKSEMIEGFIAAIRDRVQRALREGHDVPGWKLVAGRAQREWVSESAVEMWAMQPGLPIEVAELYDKSMRSPAQIEKLVGKKNLPPELWRKVSKSEKLVREGDPRPALPTSAQRTFEALPPASTSTSFAVAEPETSIES